MDTTAQAFVESVDTTAQALVMWCTIGVVRANQGDMGIGIPREPCMYGMNDWGKEEFLVVLKQAFRRVA